VEIGRVAGTAEVEGNILHRIGMRGNAGGESGHRGADDTAAFASGSSTASATTSKKCSGTSPTGSEVARTPAQPARKRGQADGT